MPILGKCPGGGSSSCGFKLSGSRGGGQFGGEREQLENARKEIAGDVFASGVWPLLSNSGGPKPWKD